MVYLLGALMPIVDAEPSNCSDLHTLVVSAERALLFGDVATCQEHLRSIEQRFECGVLPDVSTLRTDLGTYALIQGYLAHLEESVEIRQFWLQQSLNLDVWSPNFGPEVQELRSALTPELNMDVVTLPTVLNESSQLWVDGEQQSLPLSITPGLHWLWLTHQDEVVWNKVVVIDPGESLIFPSDVGVNSPSERRVLAPTLASGIFLGSLTMASHVMATWKHNQIPYSTSMNELNQHYRQSQILGWTSVGTLTGATLSLWYWRRIRTVEDREPS